MSDDRFVDRVVMITGAGGGMGRAIASEFLRAGANVVLIDIDGDILGELTAELGESDRVAAIELDITEADAPDRALGHAISAFGRIDGLVNNAGIVRFRRLEDYEPQDWDDVLDVNLRAPFLMSQAVGRHLLDVKQPGVIVNVASIGGRTANPHNAPYGVSKSGLISLTQQMAVEWGPFDIRVNVVNPGLTTWRMKGLDPSWRLEVEYADLVPLDRVVEPVDIAAAVAFLASDAARCITGVVLDVDGGFLLNVMSRLPLPEPRPGD